MILQVDVTVECDACGDEASFELNDLSEVQLNQALKSDGWERQTGPTGPMLICELCAGEASDEPDEDDDLDTDEE